MKNSIRLEEKEVAILVEALDAWVSKDLSGFMMSSLLGGLLNKDDPEARKKELEREKVKLENDTESRKKKAIILKAKLFQYQELLMDEKSNKTVAVS